MTVPGGCAPPATLSACVPFARYEKPASPSKLSADSATILAPVCGFVMSKSEMSPKNLSVSRK